jgi:hypothetical protein
MVVGSLFYDAFSVTRQHSVDGGVQVNDDELERIW